jgi:chromosome segregation ATPase
VKLIQVENEQLYRELDAKQRQLNDATKKFDELRENQEKSLQLIDNQKRFIQKLEDEAEQNLGVWQRKLEGANAESSDLKSRLEKEVTENRKLNETVVELNKHVDRYKRDLQNFNFKEFVSMKRELNALRQEKERHFIENASSGVGGQNAINNGVAALPLPPIKPSNNNIFNFFK